MDVSQGVPVWSWLAVVVAERLGWSLVVKAATALPAQAFNMVHDRWRRAVDAGEFDAPTQRLGGKLGAAFVEWADAEVPGDMDTAKFAAVIARLQKVPVLGPWVARYPDKAAELLKAVWAAGKAQLDAENATDNPKA
jgi:hypothetical protein